MDSTKMLWEWNKSIEITKFLFLYPMEKSKSSIRQTNRWLSSKEILKINSKQTAKWELINLIYKFYESIWKAKCLRYDCLLQL